jgi:hypothetical protein
MYRLFHFSGRKSPKLNDDSGDEITLIETAQSAGSPVSLVGNSGLGWLKEPPAGTAAAKLTVAFEGKKPLNADAVHSNAWTEAAWKPKTIGIIDCVRILIDDNYVSPKGSRLVLYLY